MRAFLIACSRLPTGVADAETDMNMGEAMGKAMVYGPSATEPVSG